MSKKLEAIIEKVAAAKDMLNLKRMEHRHKKTPEPDEKETFIEDAFSEYEAISDQALLELVQFCVDPKQLAEQLNKDDEIWEELNLGRSDDLPVLHCRLQPTSHDDELEVDLVGDSNPIPLKVVGAK